jgi:hypothetical protein
VKCLISISDAVVAAQVTEAVQPLIPVENCPAGELEGRLRGSNLVFADEQALGQLQRPPTATRVVCVDKGSVAESVEHLAKLPWLSQLVTPKVFVGSGVKRLLYGVMRQQPGAEVDSLAFVGGSRIHAHRVLFYRSTDIPKRLERLEEFAGAVGARSRTIEQLNDIGTELLSNAFYDAPFEAGFLKRPPARQQDVHLPPDQPCELVYGALDDELFVRVRDCFGALTRARLIEVLLRCARGSNAVTLDESRGGAGLGMWRIFQKASRVVISVSPAASTEMLVTVPKTGLPTTSPRAWHFLFAPPQGKSASVVSR